MAGGIGREGEGDLSENSEINVTPFTSNTTLGSRPNAATPPGRSMNCLCATASNTAS